MLHVWNMYLQNWVIYEVNGGEYSTHGVYGYDMALKYLMPTIAFHGASPFSLKVGNKG